MKQNPSSAEQAATTLRPFTEQFGEDTEHCRRILGHELPDLARVSDMDLKILLKMLGRIPDP